MATPRISSKVQKVLIITLCWTVLQTATYINSYFLITDLIQYGKLSGHYAFWPDFAGNIILGLFGGLIGGYILVFRVNSGYRQTTFLSGIIKSALYFTIIYLLAAILSLFLMTFVFFAFREGLASGLRHAWDNLLEPWHTFRPR